MDNGSRLLHYQYFYLKKKFKSECIFQTRSNYNTQLSNNTNYTWNRGITVVAQSIAVKWLNDCAGIFLDQSASGFERVVLVFGVNFCTAFFRLTDWATPPLARYKECARLSRSSQNHISLLVHIISNWHWKNPYHAAQPSSQFIFYLSHSFFRL